MILQVLTDYYEVMAAPRPGGPGGLVPGKGFLPWYWRRRMGL